MKGLMPKVGWMMIALALLVSFALDFNNNAQGGAIDLRNRITGVRLMENGIDAYHYKWHIGEPLEYADVYNNPKLPVSKTTGTPALLLVNMPLALLPYRLGQFLWFFAQWGLLLGTGWLWLRACETARARWLVTLFVTGFTYTAAWRLHAERGQAYVLLAFLFAWWLTRTRDAEKSDGFLAGFLAGVLVALRPPFVFLLPFAALHRRGQLAGAAAGLLLGFGLPLLVNSDCWSDYSRAMQTQSEYYRSGVDLRPGRQTYPAKIEGVPTRILANYVAIPYADFSVHALLRELGFAPFPVWPLLLAIALPFGLWLIYSRAEPVEMLLPGMAAWLFLTDLFLPAYRDSYNDVLILDVVLVGVVGARSFPWPAWAAAVALPIGWAIYVLAPEQAWLINLPTLCFTLSAILFAMSGTFLFNNCAGSRKVAAAC
jgi:hypothetical protein